jgi:hypothetical protein
MSMNAANPLTGLILPIDTIITGSLYFIIGAYAIFTGVLYYHWKTYGTDAKITNLTLILYFATTIPLVIIMTIMAVII